MPRTSFSPLSYSYAPRPSLSLILLIFSLTLLVAGAVSTTTGLASSSSTSERRSVPASEQAAAARAMMPVPAMLVAGATITVNTTDDGTPNASDGKCMLREAIAASTLNAVSGSVPGECAAGSSSAIDTIVFDPTVFDTSGMHTITLQGLSPNLPGSITIQGPGSNFLTINGNNFRIFYAGATNGPVVISGMTLTHGKSPSGSSNLDGTEAEGGGAILSFSDLTLTDVVLIANRGGDGGNGSSGVGGAGGVGGAIYNRGTLTMTACVLNGNIGGRGGDGGNGGQSSSPGVGGAGGAIYNKGTLTMTACVVSGNTGGRGGDGLTSTGGDGGSGGGIYSDQGPVTLTNVTISNNSGGHSGTVNNPNGNFGGHGGGLYIRSGVVQLIDSTVSGNNAGLNGPTASGYAGGIENGGSMTIVRSTVSGNTAYNSGGGILNRFSLTMLNSTVSGNRILSGGLGAAINTDGSTTLVLTNCTITGNSSATGPGVSSFTSPGPTVKNTIIAANGSGPDVLGNFNSQGYNLIGYTDGSPFGGSSFVNGVNGDKVGTSAAPLDPKVGPLANNGGPTQTHALLVGSPAIDAGADTYAINAGLTTDQRGPGFPRIADGPDADAIATVDIGAFEVQLSIEDITDKTTNEDTPLSFNFNIGDYTDANSSVTVTSANQALVPDSNLIVTGTGHTRTLQITPTANKSGTVTINVNVNAINCQVCADSFVLTVNPVNDAPTLDVIGNVVIPEDAPTQTVNLTGITAGGGETQNLTVVSTTTSNPALIPNPSDSYTSPNSTGSLSFTPAANASGTAIISVTVTDDGGTANGGVNTFTRSFTVTVTPVNDAPVVNVPNPQNVAKNTNLTFLLAIGNRIFVLDPDAGSNLVQVTLTVTNGTITLSGTTGLSFSNGDGTTDTTMTFTGTIANINTALNGLVYTPTQNFVGTATLSVTANDLGNTGAGGALTDSKSVNISVNSGGTLQFNASTYTSPENNAIVTVTVTRTGGSAGFTTVNYATSNGTATAGSDYLATSGTLTFDSGITTRTFGVQVINDSTSEPDETVNLTLSNVQGSGDLGTPATAVLTITNDDAPRMQFSQANYSVSETSAFLNISVTRTGDINTPSTVKYATSDSTDVNFNCNPNTAGQPTIFASRKCDYHIAAGTLRFAAGETSKQFSLSIVNDVYFEAAETLNITLSNPVGGILGQNTVVPVTITDTNETGGVNPIDNTRFFVRQLYVDLLSREPDPAGWDGWTNRIDLCGQTGQPPPPCDRVTVAGDGFLRSGEFFDRQFFVLRLYRTGLGRILRYDEVADLAFVSGFLTEAQLELNKQDLVLEIMSRPEFSNRYSGLTNAAFVDALLQTAAVIIPQGDRDQLVSDLNTSTKTRARVYRDISERAEVSAKYLHEAQVVSAYYGFFSRNPDGAYLNYLQRLDAGEITLGDLANAFINAQEYRQRFGQ